MEYLELFENAIQDDPIPHNGEFLRDRQNPFDYYSDFDFRDRFRLHKGSVNRLHEMIDFPQYANNRGNPIPSIYQLLITLRYYADGTFHRETGDLLNISEASTCRIVHRVSRLIGQLRPLLLRFPSNEEARAIKSDFYLISNFPGM